jgi:hypothetical protein
VGAFGSLKYGHLYRLEIDDGYQLGLEIESYRRFFDGGRPHPVIRMRRPLDVHLEAIAVREKILNSTEFQPCPRSAGRSRAPTHTAIVAPVGTWVVSP